MPSNRPTAILADRARYARTRSATPYRKQTTRARCDAQGSISLRKVGIEPHVTYLAVMSHNGSILLQPLDSKRVATC